MKKSTLIFVILSSAASVLNFLIYPALSRILPGVEFVNMTVALALFTQLSSFMLCVVALTIGLSKQDNASVAKILAEKLQTILVHLFIVVTVILLLTSRFFLKELRLPVTMLLPILFMLALSISMSVITGYLNGKQKLAKLGVAIAFSAALQLFFSLTAGITTKSGVATVSAMAFATFLAIILIYFFYSSENLPNPRSIFAHGLGIYKIKEIRKLVRYTILASLATLFLNISMILDLLIINSRNIDSIVYTDLYVISRIVFFGGMLLIWPFLSVLNLKSTRKNIIPFLKLCAALTAIAIALLCIMYFRGDFALKLLLGSSYDFTNSIRLLSILSIIYKFVFLIITALLLYFIVIRSYWIVWLSLSVIIPSVVFTYTLKPGATSVYIVAGLILISSLSAIFGIWGFVRTAYSTDITAMG